ncbi:hypothetical protein RhiirB3_457631 [Rhizophagus irregularis]|nr:hypothetical protein RhiirB3_457631 [Rhizophagus irregularis]
MQLNWFFQLYRSLDIWVSFSSWALDLYSSFSYRSLDIWVSFSSWALDLYGEF